MGSEYRKTDRSMSGDATVGGGGCGDVGCSGM